VTTASIPGFELGDLIGRGGCAAVYRARQLSVGRDVAVKIDNRHVTHARDRRRFAREVTAVARLSGHPNVVEIFDAGVLEDARPYIAMQLCPGGTLQDLVRDGGPLPFPQAQRTGLDVAQALVAAHAAGIMHRDVKPANILVTAYGVPVLSDFGLASIVGADRRQTATRGVFTPAYAPPEALGVLDATPAGDFYSFACTMFELVTGRLPHFRWHGGPITVAEIVAAAVEGPGEPGPDLPRGFVAWLQRGLAHEPGDRWPSAAVMREELATLDIHSPTAIPPARGPGEAVRTSTPADPPPPTPTNAWSLATSASASVSASASPRAGEDGAGRAGPRWTPSLPRPWRPTTRVSRPWLVSLAAASIAAASIAWTTSSRSSATAVDARLPAPASTAAASPAAASAPAPASAPTTGPAASLDDDGSWVLDGARVHSALKLVEAAVGHELRLTGLVAARAGVYSQLRVEVQDPSDRQTVLLYAVDRAGRVHGPTQVSSMSLADPGASRVTAAMVDRRTFRSSVFPPAGQFRAWLRTAARRTEIRDGAAAYWTMNAHTGRVQMLIGVESPYGNAIVAMTPDGGVIQVMD